VIGIWGAAIYVLKFVEWSSGSLEIQPPRVEMKAKVGALGGWGGALGPSAPPDLRLLPNPRLPVVAQ